MPTNRTRTTRKRKIGPAAGWKSKYLLSGEWPPEDTPDYNPFDGLSFDDRPRKGISPAQELWELKRKELLHYWIAKYPGTRPFAWWQCDAQENRKQVGGKGVPGHKCLRLVPHYRLGISTCWGQLSRDEPPQFESQATYLERLGLLTPMEQRRLTKKDYAPEILTRS